MIKVICQALQSDLQGADAEHHSTCLTSHLLFQYGKVRDESENVTISYELFRYQCYDE